ncbi:hypothetical protein C2G38_2251860 [Gigaspora rosea]|uniref:Helicase superfamily 3 single-stranded DNA/RNA virus domain-containing protein n=2 Tax=Gigaspora rosea TaxID=44941 RepID=A0A397UMW4_9GLOM|nr:hypothetical protein C2G38_2251860 [Gigaspora rosea]
MTKITSETRFRKFNFTLYEKLDTIYSHITNLFNDKSCPFSILKFQFELNYNSKEPGKHHVQGFARVRKGQLRLGSYDSITQKGSGIKEIFEANIHIEFANGTDDECLAYTGKEYNRCKNPNHQKCKCDLFDLSKICKKCNETCERTFARISEDSNIAGPFEFIFDENKFKNNKKQESNNEEEIYYEMAVKEVMNGKDVDEVIVKYAYKCKNWGRTTQGLRDIARATKKQTINPLKEVNRFWEPCIIYIYGDTGTGKSNLCKELFPGIYQKDDIKQFENYNNDEFDYKRDTAILLDDFYGSNISWTNFLRLTNENHCLMDVKYGKTKIVAMYICITSNGPIENLYKNLRERNSSIDIKAFIRRVRFIIKFEGDPIDSRIGKGNVIRIFEKGNKQDFNNRIFDIEFNKETTLEQAEKVTIDLGIEGTIFQDTVTGYYYWRQSWENEINKYSTIENIDDITDRIITNIPKSDPGKRIIVSSSKDKKTKNIKHSKQHNFDEYNPQIESSKRKHEDEYQIQENTNKKQKLNFENNQFKNSDTESEYSSISGYDTDDSENTKEQKRKNKTKGKKPKYKNQFKLSQQEQFDIDKDIQFEIDQQQFQIQQNYQKDLNKQQVIKSDDDFDYTEDVELDIADEEFYEQFARENKYNNNYSGFKRMFKRL